MEQHLLVTYFHEIALKGKNRDFFSHRAQREVDAHLRGTGVRRVWHNPMLACYSLRDADLDLVHKRLATTFGVEKYYMAHRVPATMDAIKDAVAQALQGRVFGSFRISARRADKRFALNSVEINIDLGAFVKTLTGARVDLSHPDLDINVYVLPGHAYVYFEDYHGPGGFPIGVSGKVVALLSGGIDSPVAAWRMMRRGCQVTLVHFHSYPLVDGASREKAEDLTRVLNRWQVDARLILVPFADLQRDILLSTPPDHRVVLYRRFMFRIAQLLARREGAGALVTGESLGQVASQTLENLTVIEAVADMPVLRPLIGMDKVEIKAQAQTLGTYEISIQPDQDCCSLFVPKHPVTRSRLPEVERIETLLDVAGLVQRAVEGVEVKEFTGPESTVTV